MKEHNIDKLFRQKLQEHSVKPTPAAWDKVAGNLNAGRRKREGYYGAAAAVVLLLIVSWIGLRQWDTVDILNGKQQTTVAVQEHPTQSRPHESVGTGTSEPTSGSTSTEEAVEQSQTTAPQPPVAPAQLAAVETSKAASTTKKAVPATAEKQEADPALQPDVLQVTPETTLAQELPAAPKRLEESMPLPPTRTVLPSADNALASAEQVVIRYDASTTDEAPEDQDRDNAPEKVLSLMKKVKHGEIGLANIRKAKDNLLSGRFNKP